MEKIKNVMFHKSPYIVFYIWKNYAKYIDPEQAVEMFNKIQSGTHALRCEKIETKVVSKDKKNNFPF